MGRDKEKMRGLQNCIKNQTKKIIDQDRHIEDLTKIKDARQFKIVGLKWENKNLLRSIEDSEDAQKVLEYRATIGRLNKELKLSNERLAKGEQLKAMHQAPADLEYKLAMVKKACWYLISSIGFVLAAYAYSGDW